MVAEAPSRVGRWHSMTLDRPGRRVDRGVTAQGRVWGPRRGLDVKGIVCSVRPLRNWSSRGLSRSRYVPLRVVLGGTQLSGGILVGSVLADDRPSDSAQDVPVERTR